MRIDELFSTFSSRLGLVETESGNQIVSVPKGVLRVRVGDYGSSYSGDTYSDVVCLSRHFVRKPLYRIALKGGRSVTTTCDHTCMRICGEDGTGFVFERASAKDLSRGDLMCVSRPEMILGEVRCDTKAEVESVEELPNTDGRWVYDLEVSSGAHVYFADGILVHNSQFISLAPILQSVQAKDGSPTDVPFSRSTEEERKATIEEAYHIVDLANENVARLVGDECHTSHGDILHYSLEYIAAEGMYFKKKHYIVRKVLSDDLPCDKFKYSGISVKKAEIPASMKDFLRRIYETTMKGDWNEATYRREVEAAYRSFVGLDWGDIAYWRKYKTPKRTISLTESEKGAGVHARAANFYNCLIERLGLAGKYPKIGIRDEFRYLYVLPTNEYGMDCLAFKGEFPEEFRPLFRPDYDTMFSKIFTKSLENYVKVMRYREVDPTRREEAPEFSIF